MFLCYIDEAGDEQSLRTRTDPPVLVIGGLIVEETHAQALVWDFLQLKKRFNPSLNREGVKLSEVVAFEIKGSNLRADMRSTSRRRRRAAFGILDAVLDLLERHNAVVLGDIHIKGPGNLGRWVYSKSVSTLADQFETLLRAAGSTGLMILDARTKSKNVPSVNGITTQRFRSGGGSYPHLVESPVFGHSDAHVSLQIADLIVSALLFPMACAGYCLCLLDNTHPSSEYLDVRERYGARLRLLEHKYLASDGRRAGGIRVRDNMNHQPTLAIFQEVPFTLRAPAAPPLSARESVALVHAATATISIESPATRPRHRRVNRGLSGTGDRE
ncbi:DUF3800 domain-containing protein [Microbacterium sp. 1.5R]|uniref:DUF3800 domain-containing protein n=1 Tax=Microbacterium sp. 1.5R TaxID=1916917 RepID=UPI0016427912|nr:DUF3800 domain-containing protein [Microbacterium sp. 1.5R]